MAPVDMVGRMVGERIRGLEWEALNRVLPEMGDGKGVTWLAAKTWEGIPGKALA